jgi:hypothetical protein
MTAIGMMWNRGSERVTGNRSRDGRKPADGDIVSVKITAADAYDLMGRAVGTVR